MAAPINLAPPTNTPLVDPKTGLVTVPWSQFFARLSSAVNKLVNP